MSTSLMKRVSVTPYSLFPQVLLCKDWAESRWSAGNGRFHTKVIYSTDLIRISAFAHGPRKFADILNPKL